MNTPDSKPSLFRSGLDSYPRQLAERGNEIDFAHNAYLGTVQEYVFEGLKRLVEPFENEHKIAAKIPAITFINARFGELFKELWMQEVFYLNGEKVHVDKADFPPLSLQDTLTIQRFGSNFRFSVTGERNRVGVLFDGISDICKPIAFSTVTYAKRAAVLNRYWSQRDMLVPATHAALLIIEEAKSLEFTPVPQGDILNPVD